jgi:2-amino-4-hydroxy-6-hydroxymethyldihydropteridine diphosphokinase
MILIALGANLPSPAGPPAATLRAVLLELQRRKVTVLDVSRFYETSAWPDPGDPRFVNAVALVRTAYDPARLLSLLREIEAAFGRETARQNAPRTLDLDILDYDGLVQSGPPILPHPRLHDRRFVLVPLMDVAPDWRHPISGLDIGAQIAALPLETSEVTRLP